MFFFCVKGSEKRWELQWLNKEAKKRWKYRNNIPFDFN